MSKIYLEESCKTSGHVKGRRIKIGPENKRKEDQVEELANRQLV